MAQSVTMLDDSSSAPETSPLNDLIDQIELILTSPAKFASSTPEDRLAPLLQKLRSFEDVDDRVVRIERWYNQLGDACRAAFARETITRFLAEVESWPDWIWNSTAPEVEERKVRVEQIKNGLGELPIEWLKTRVTELRKSEKELHPPAYLTIHITFSLLPPLATLHGHLQVYKVRFRVWDISQTFFSIMSTLKSFLTVPSLFTSTDEGREVVVSSTEALALTVEAGLLLDRMIDISVEEKGDPIPDSWIDEYEQVEQMVGRITKEDFEKAETPSPDPVEKAEPQVSLLSSPELVMKRDFTRSSLVESIFSSPRSDRLEDSLSSIEDDLPEHLRIKHGHDSDDESNGDELDNSRILDEVNEPLKGENDSNFNLDEELRRDEERIFDREYHAIATPPREETTGEVDHSPFLARVIAELEDMEPYLPQDDQQIPIGEHIGRDLHFVKVEDEDYDPQHPFQNLQLNRDDMHEHMSNEEDLDIDAIYEALVTDADSGDDGDFLQHSPGMRDEIRTSSPIFEDQDMHYDQLESSDEESDEDPPPPHETTVIVDTIDDDDDIDIDIEDTTERLSHINLDPFSSPQKPTRYITQSDDDLDETITLPLRSSPFKTLSRSSSPALSLPPSTPSSLRTSHLHSKVTQIAHSHPTIALIPQTQSFRPTQTSEYGVYTLRPSTSHSRHSSVSSDTPEPRRVDVGGTNLYVRILSDRVMVRVGGGWVDLDSYLREYIGKREAGRRRRSGSVEPIHREDFEFLEIDEPPVGGTTFGRRNVTTPAGVRATTPFEGLGERMTPPVGSGGRSVSALGSYHSPPGAGGRTSAMEFRRSVSPALISPGLDEMTGMNGAGSHGSIGRSAGGGVTRRMYVRRK